MLKGLHCTAIIVVPYDHLAHLLKKLRHNFFSTMEGKLSRRYARGEELTSKRQRKSTAELEERIRLHWPRKGYADVKYRQPRVYEISQHQKKLERQKSVQLSSEIVATKKYLVKKLQNPKRKLFQLKEKLTCWSPC